MNCSKLSDDLEELIDTLTELQHSNLRGFTFLAEYIDYVKTFQQTSLMERKTVHLVITALVICKTTLKIALTAENVLHILSFLWHKIHGDDLQVALNQAKEEIPLIFDSHSNEYSFDTSNKQSWISEIVFGCCVFHDTWVRNALKEEIQIYVKPHNPIKALLALKNEMEDLPSLEQIQEPSLDFSCYFSYSENQIPLSNQEGLNGQIHACVELNNTNGEAVRETQQNERNKKRTRPSDICVETNTGDANCNIIDNLPETVTFPPLKKSKRTITTENDNDLFSQTNNWKTIQSKEPSVTAKGELICRMLTDNHLTLEQLQKMNEFEFGYFCGKSGFSKEQMKSIVHFLKQIKPVHTSHNDHSQMDPSTVTIKTVPLTEKALKAIKDVETHKNRLDSIMTRLKYVDESLEWRAEAEREEITRKINALVKHLQIYQQQLLSYATNLQTRAKLELFLITETTAKQQQIVANAIEMQNETLKNCEDCQNIDLKFCTDVQNILQDNIKKLNSIDYATNARHIQDICNSFHASMSDLSFSFCHYYDKIKD
ncbi:hypothetical protein RFI_19612 [Reticulomyxa filosa]|uniref:Uncharacterized protein n=1 Tax=Reticulomyxa filosa TaxID=46433 RepID=X6MVN0_RETFI|nr:hypothetical protein RFI_19612 [Reticulomyxa filosa]|eukprot:ETO17706.1 hypothetical protein RFI_19612 [Reticulomyxa filosa]